MNENLIILACFVLGIVAVLIYGALAVSGGGRDD